MISTVFLVPDISVQVDAILSYSADDHEVERSYTTNDLRDLDLATATRRLLRD
jgi:hypothetical protein